MAALLLRREAQRHDGRHRPELGDFIARVNSDLIGKYINIASRAAGFLVKRFAGRIDDAAMAHPLLGELRAAAPAVAGLYEQRDYSKALRQVMELADAVNGYVDTVKPWELAKDPERAARAARGLQRLA